MYESSLYIVWDEDCLTGVPILDEQHRGLVTAANSVYYYISNDLGTLSSAPYLDYFVHFMNVHFKTKELLMKKSKCPNQDEYTQAHLTLMEDAKMYVKIAKEEKDPLVILKYLKDIWIPHTKDFNQRYGEIIREALHIHY